MSAFGVGVGGYLVAALVQFDGELVGAFVDLDDSVMELSRSRGEFFRSAPPPVPGSSTPASSRPTPAPENSRADPPSSPAADAWLPTGDTPTYADDEALIATLHAVWRWSRDTGEAETAGDSFADHRQ
ncbi:hypothetical protein SD37_39585 [Amycolatopsis orientalis]|uniref:Uncharacterized protein n=1 Tax=Amycolatopsis orientalis TaxID=31958 RepID=A0A193C908_AMYOR|nr:hypothetical protein SD37_39585 [Amycolatopsis orientalis]